MVVTDRLTTFGEEILHERQKGSATENAKNPDFSEAHSLRFTQHQSTALMLYSSNTHRKRL